MFSCLIEKLLLFIFVIYYQCSSAMGWKKWDRQKCTHFFT